MWSSKKHSTIALSTTEVEYIALTEGTRQLIWLWRFLLDLSFNQSHPKLILSDNLSALTLSHDATYHACTKHINVAYHYIHKKVASNKAALTYVKLKDNLTDLMTKPLDLFQHRYLHKKLGLVRHEPD